MGHGKSIFDFLNTDQNAKFFVFEILVWTFSFQICFWNYFLNFQKLIAKADLKLECPYYNSKFLLKRFSQYKKKSKMDFQLYFQNVIWLGGGGDFFILKKIFLKLKTPKI